MNLNKFFLQVNSQNPSLSIAHYWKVTKMRHPKLFHWYEEEEKIPDLIEFQKRCSRLVVWQGITWEWFTTGWLRMKPRRTSLSVSRVLTSPKTIFLSGFLIHSIHSPIHPFICQSIPFIQHLLTVPFPELLISSLTCQSILFDQQTIFSFSNPFPHIQSIPFIANLFPHLLIPCTNLSIHSRHLPIHSLICQSKGLDFSHNDLSVMVLST